MRQTLAGFWLCSMVSGCAADDGADDVGDSSGETGDTAETGTGTSDDSSSGTSDDSSEDTTSDDADTSDADTTSEDTTSDDGTDDADTTDTGDPSTRIVFLSSSLHDGDLGGLAGADSICTMLAQDAGLPGTYMAWLSTDQESPSTRFVQSTVPYVTVGGTMVAADWADLTDGTLTALVNLTESGGPPQSSTYVCNGTARQSWTGTNPDGSAAANTCSNFTSTASTGAIGRNTSTTEWSICNPGVACTNMAPLYCFQQ